MQDRYGTFIPINLDDISGGLSSGGSPSSIHRFACFPHAFIPIVGNALRLEVQTNGQRLKTGNGTAILAVFTHSTQAAKMVGWAAGIGATAFAASYLTSYNDSKSIAHGDAENNGRSADIKQLDLPISSRPHGSPSTVIRDFLLAAGGICGLLGVAGGAFGFHGLKRSACIFVFSAGCRCSDK